MNAVKCIVKKIISKLFSQLLMEIEQVKDIQKEILNQNIELDGNIKELKNNNIEELNYKSEINNKIDNLNNYIIKIEQENTRLKNYIANISLTLDRKKSIRKIRVAFLIHNVESWYTMQPIYESMLEDSVFDPILISVPRNYSHNGIFKDKSKEYLRRKYNKVISFESIEKIPNDIMFILNPDIIFRQSPWEDDIPDVFRTENIKQFKICYIPYGIITIPVDELHFNQNLHKYAWRLYCESKFHKECYRKHNLILDSNAVISGYTKFEQMNKLLNNDSEELSWPIKRKTKPSLRILWAPHHSLEGWFGFSTFHIIYEKMYDFALNNNDVEIVLRPHPALTDVMNNSGLIKKDDLEEYYKKFNDLDNCYLDFNEEYINLFKYSDVLITDGVSFLFEYIITGKPIIHTDSKKHIGFNEFGKQFESSWYKGYSFNDLKQYIEMIKNNDDPLLEKRLELKEKLFDFSNENKPSKIIINDIKNSLLNE
ncbi:CDP-glycerol glycerophosphotransferase family protein [Clostridium sp. VAP51]|uniref:CDP-glycerol glycerophosphotransferase family protein n=1 Tax=Clostridium sp. VAP51 TaxID=2949978 RepID=UPI00207AEC10|nr:CDP-glycerol glycerophosphotransferase family protein [Clostridium sp. VAP51]